MSYETCGTPGRGGTRALQRCGVALGSRTVDHHVMAPPALRACVRVCMQNALWSAKRNRDRISEIINYLERNMLELDEAAGEEDAGEA